MWTVRRLRKTRGRRWPCLAVIFFLLLLLPGFLFVLVTLLPAFERTREDHTQNHIVFPLSDDGPQRWSFGARKPEGVGAGSGGIQVVVGHYLGSKSEDSVHHQPLSQDELNRNSYHPVPGLGENGEPVQLSPIEAQKIRKYYDVNKFNLVASDKIAVNRTLPDVRRKECLAKEYPSDEDLPSTSVIIVFHNEAWSTLLRTIHSIINRSPASLLAEIILVDDASQRSFLRDDLDEYVSRLEVPVTVIHVEERVGLIRARLRGAALATGEVLTFLDAHCECTEGWLRPLLARIAEDGRKVVCPIIDIINDDTFAFVRSFEMHWGAINWGMHFRWFAVGEETSEQRKKDITAPFKTPVMAGGLFSIKKDYFYELGTYDEQMDIWGGENIELSFRVWQCGGSVEIVPCSHVGHVFRRASPYTFPRKGGIAGVLFANLARVALVWMDEWKEFFFHLHPEAQAFRKVLNVTSRVQLRNQLNCKDFQWYLANVWPENFFPSKNGFFGKVKNAQTGECLRRPRAQNGANQATGNAITSPCNHLVLSPTLIVFRPSGYLMSDESVCLDVPDFEHRPFPSVFFLACGRLERQRWKYKDQFLIHELSSMCLDLVTNHEPSKKSVSSTLVLKTCSSEVPSQRWIFEPFQWR